MYDLSKYLARLLMPRLGYTEAHVQNSTVLVETLDVSFVFHRYTGEPQCGLSFYQSPFKNHAGIINPVISRSYS